MEYSQAKSIADNILEQLRPHCERCQIAGSIRRLRPEVKDIEIVAIPKPFETGLFETGIASVVNQWNKIKGDITPEARYTQRMLPENIKLDLFLCNTENWGYIFTLRTGSANFSKNLMIELNKKGFRAHNGDIYYKGTKMRLYEETDLFSLIKKPFLSPEERI